MTFCTYKDPWISISIGKKTTSNTTKELLKQNREVAVGQCDGYNEYISSKKKKKKAIKYNSFN